MCLISGLLEMEGVDCVSESKFKLAEKIKLDFRFILLFLDFSRLVIEHLSQVLLFQARVRMALTLSFIVLRYICCMDLHFLAHGRTYCVGAAVNL